MIAHPLTRALASSLIAAGPPTIEERDSNDPQANVDGDDRLLDRLLDPRAPERLQRVWFNRPCLVASRAQARSTAFALATADCNLPVAVRPSGGSAVVHHSGTLQLSLALRQDGFSIDKGYQALAALLDGAVAAWGISVSLGSAPGSYCDGRFSILANGRKLAGTAAYFRRRQSVTLGLFHLTISVAGDLEEDVAHVTRFETALGHVPQYDPIAHSTLQQILCL